MITNNSVVKIQNLVVNHKSQLVKSKPDMWVAKLIKPHTCWQGFPNWWGWGKPPPSHQPKTCSPPNLEKFPSVDSPTNFLFPLTKGQSPLLIHSHSFYAPFLEGDGVTHISTILQKGWVKEFFLEKLDGKGMVNFQSRSQCLEIAIISFTP